jgi:hypothetical protein
MFLTAPPQKESSRRPRFPEEDFGAQKLSVQAHDTQREWHWSRFFAFSLLFTFHIYTSSSSKEHDCPGQAAHCHVSMVSFYGSFNNVFSSSDYTVSNGRMIN